MNDEARPVALVVGGASGIGAALVAAYHEQGTRTVVWDVAGERDVTCDVADRPRWTALWPRRARAGACPRG